MVNIEKNLSDALILDLISKSCGIDIPPTRTQIQKEMFVAKILCYVPLQYEFVIHDFGPYSFELDQDIRELLAFGYINDVSEIGQIGSRYELTEVGKSYLERYKDNTREYSNQLDQAVRLLAGHNVGVLELASTAIYVIEVLKVDDKDKALKTIKHIKPKYSDGKIKEFYDVSLEVVKEFKEEFAPS
jgi:uncharacterized protein YwgA